MKRLYFAGLMILCYFLAGCAAQPKMYYWGEYSESLYSYKKEPSDDSLRKHKQVLFEIIEKSDAGGMKVPPGVYCEYGYISMKEGNKKEASRYFDLEAQTYPESKVFIQQLKSRLE